MQKHLQVSESVVDSQVLERILRLQIDPLGSILRMSLLPTRPGVTAFSVELEGGRGLIVKIREGSGQDVFDEEAHQLGYLASKSPLPVPKVLSLSKGGKAGPFTCLVLQRPPGVPWSRLDPSSSGRERDEVQRNLGDLLGRMHAGLTAIRFGEVRPEPSPGYSSWPEFFSGLWARRLDEVIVADRLDPPTLDAVGWIRKSLVHLVATNDSPRLVHGNLSGTRILCHPEGEEWKVSGILEPALLYGHHEVDVALLELLCGVHQGFFESYAQHIALSDGYELRKYVYMLYFALEDVRLYGHTHHILTAVDYAREVLHRCGC